MTEQGVPIVLAEESSAGASLTLRELVDSICERIRNHPDFYTEVGRGVHAPLTGTIWSDRASEWFPANPLQLPSKKMQRETYDLIKTALSRYTDRLGRRIITDDELTALDRGFERYIETSYVATKASSKDLIGRLKKMDPRISANVLQECEGFRHFLLHSVYSDIVSGQAPRAREKTLLLYSASSDCKGSDKIAKNEKVRTYQMQACIALLGFIGYVSEDGTEQFYVKRMADENNQRPSAFLRARMLTHGAHHVEGSQNHIALLQLVQDGLDVEIPTYERVASSSFHNAVRACVERGMRLDDLIPDCNGMSLERAIDEGIAAHHKFGDSDSYIRHEILRIRGYGNAKNFDKAFEKCHEIKIRVMQRTEEGELMPHVHLRLLQANADLYEALAKEGVKYSREFAIQVLVDAVQLARQYKLIITEKKIKMRIARLENGNGT